MTAIRDLAAPRVHLNGTSRDELLEQLSAAAHAVAQALRVIEHAAPNQRDYYVQAPGTWEKAVDQHRDRLVRLSDVHDELTALYEAVVGPQY